ncbi:MAG: hypothetical protein ACE5O2_02700, partial [Armatimonadota bacterium]
GGRWTIVYRERDRPVAEEVVLWDSAEAEKRASAWDVPCWLPLVITVRCQGLVDGRGRPYTGPLMAKTSGACKIVGPYPEGFICAIKGAFEITVVPEFQPFTPSVIGLSIYYRVPPVFVEVEGQTYPQSPDYHIGVPYEERGIWGRYVRFSTPEHSEQGFRMSPVKGEVIGRQRLLSAEAFFALPGGVPARKLPVQFEWVFDRGEGAPDVRVVHEGATDTEGRAFDTITVPIDFTKGRIEFWTHEFGPDYIHASGQKFDFSNGQG